MLRQSSRIDPRAHHPFGQGGSMKSHTSSGAVSVYLWEKGGGSEVLPGAATISLLRHCWRSRRRFLFLRCLYFPSLISQDIVDRHVRSIRLFGGIFGDASGTVGVTS